MIGDQVRLTAVVVDVGDVGLVRVPVPERDGGFGAVDQRKVESCLECAGERLCQPQGHAFAATGPFLEIEVEADGVVALLGQVGVLILAR
ncbi:hypothetical protein D3C71_1884970 [compost metagenome]